MQIRDKTPPWDVPTRAHSQKRQSAQSTPLNMTLVKVSVMLMAQQDFKRTDSPVPRSHRVSLQAGAL